MRKLFGTLALFAALGLPLPALAVQYDGIKNLSPSTRSYNLLNPTQTISISPGQTVIIQDTQFQSSSALNNDVAHGYINQYVIGSPNSTQTSYTQPVTITSTSNSAPGLNIAESAGSQPAISATQTNSGDIMDLYQSQAPELLFSNTLFHLYTPAVFQNNLSIGAGSPNAGQLTFGQSGSTYLAYVQSGGAPGVANFNSGTFGFANGPISTNSSNGYYIGTYQVLNSDNAGNNTTLHSQNGTFGFANGGTNFATLNATCLALGSSCYGANANVAGNLTVGGTTNFNGVLSTGVTTPVLIGNLDLNLQPGDSSHAVNIRNSAGTTTQQFSNDGSFTLANNKITSDANGNLKANSLFAPTLAVANAGQFSNVGNLTYLSSAANGGFQVRNSAGTNDLLKLNDNGSGTLLGNVTVSSAGVLTAPTLNSSGNATISGQLNVSGPTYGADIYADRTNSSGYVFFGNSGTHSLGYDGGQYLFGTGVVTLQGYLNANAGLNAGGIQILPAGTATSGASYNSGGLAFFNSTWNGSAPVSNNAYIIENTGGQLTSSAPFVAPQIIGSTSVNTQNIFTQFVTGSPNALFLQTSGNNSYPVNIGGNAVNFSTNQPIEITGQLTVNGNAQFNSPVSIGSTLSTGSVLSSNRLVYSGSNPGAAATGTATGDIVADRGDGSAQYFYGNNRNNYMYYNGSQYFLAGGTLNIVNGGLNIQNGGNISDVGGNLTVGSINTTGSVGIGGVVTSNGIYAYGQQIGKVYRRQTRPVLGPNPVGGGPGYYNGTLSLGQLAGPSSQVYDLYAHWFANDWASSGGGLLPQATLTGSGGTWEANSVTERDIGQVSEQAIDYIGTATGGQSPSVSLMIQYMAQPNEMGAFTLEAVAR
jgi:hypothetical protein